MSKFDTYFLMKAEDAIEYAQLKVPQKDWDVATMTCKEIGDGNLNYVFKVQDGKGNSVIVKQAGTVTAYLRGYEAGHRPQPHRVRDPDPPGQAGSRLCAGDLLSMTPS